MGRRTADDFGWELGDRIPIQGTIFRPTDGGDTWEFDIEAIYEGSEPGVDETLFMFHYDYFNESQEEVNRTYRDNFPRLLKIKKQYDPTNLFRLNANIKPG